MNEGVEVIGGEDWKASLTKKLDENPGAEQKTITVDAQGNVVGDTSELDPAILAQLQTPEAQAQIKDMYRTSRYGKKEKRETKYLNEREDRRPFAETCPPGMSRKDWRKMGRMRIHKSRKAILKTQRSLNHGGQSN